jgi:hypothetical protein
MPEFVEVHIAPDVVLLVEAPTDSETALVEAGRARDLASAAVTSFSSSLDAVQATATAAFHRMKSMDPKPSQVSLEFAIQLAAEAGVVIASSTASANMRLVFQWNDIVS